MRHPPSRPPDPHAPKPSLSVVIPCYNEVTTVKDLAAVASLAEEIVDEVVIVDDGSTDGTREVLKSFDSEAHGRLSVFYHERNQGKGAALATAFPHTTGEVIVIQDADFRIRSAGIQPAAAADSGRRGDGRLWVAFPGWHAQGDEFLEYGRQQGFDTDYEHPLQRHPQRYGNLLQMLSGARLWTGCRSRRAASISSRNSRRKCSSKGIRIVEVPISYYGREYDEGKKIRWTDAPIAAWTLLPLSLL